MVSTDKHDRHQEATVKLGITSPVKAKILEYERLKLKPKAILVQLRKAGLEQPTTRQLSNYLRYHRGKTLGTTGVTLDQLQQWANQRSAIPEDDDQVFCGKFECVALPEKIFRIFITTKRLLGFTTRATHILADATYKLITQGFPVLTCGTTDKSKQFHPYGIAVTTNEKQEDFAFLFTAIFETARRIGLAPIVPTLLVADSAESITNGFNSAFPGVEAKVSSQA